MCHRECSARVPGSPVAVLLSMHCTPKSSNSGWKKQHWLSRWLFFSLLSTDLKSRSPPTSLLRLLRLEDGYFEPLSLKLPCLWLHPAGVAAYLSTGVDLSGGFSLARSCEGLRRVE